MFDGFIKKIVGILPEKLQKLYYKYESAILYIFFGGLTTIVSIASQYIAVWLGAGTALSTTISWVCAVTFAFFTNKLYVFKSGSFERKLFMKEFFSFYGARLVSYFLELGFMLLTVDVLRLNTYLMKLIAQIFVLIANYLFSRFFVFSKSKKAENENSAEGKNGDD